MNKKLCNFFIKISESRKYNLIMNKTEEVSDYEQDFDDETLSVHTINSFKEEEISDINHKINKSVIVSSRDSSYFQVTNGFKGILKRIDCIKIPQQVKELRSISRDFLKHLDGYLDKKRISLVSQNKKNTEINIITLNRELENNNKCLMSLRNELKELTKTHLKVSQDNYKDSLEKQRRKLENNIEKTKKELNILKIEGAKRTTKILDYELFSKEVVDLQDQISLHKKKGIELTQKLEETEGYEMRTLDSMANATENFKKIKELAEFYQVKLQEVSKDRENNYQILFSKEKLIKTRINKLKEETPLKCLNLEIKSLKKKNRLLNKILNLQTQDFNGLIQITLLRNQSLSVCFEDSIKITFVEEQLKKLGLSANQSFAKSNTTKKTRQSLSPINAYPQYKIEKDVSLLNPDINSQSKELEIIINIENSHYDIKKDEKFEISSNKLVIDNNDQIELEGNLKQNLAVVEEINKINDVSQNIEENNKVNIEVLDEKNGINEKPNKIFIENIIPQNFPIENQEKIETEIVNNVIINGSSLKSEVSEIVKTQENQTIKTIDFDPPTKTFNFAQNKEKNLFSSNRKINEISNLFKEYEDAIIKEQKPNLFFENPEIKDKEQEQDQQNQKIRKIMNPSEEGINNNNYNKNENITRINMPISFKNSQIKKTNEIFNTGANYFSEFNF